MDKIKEQSTIVSQLLLSADTVDLYKKTLARTWDILREIGILLWLVICLTFVGGEWFYRTSVGLGRSARTWYVSLSEKGPETEPESMASTGQALFDTVKSSTSYLLTQARQQLGIPEPEPEPSVTPPTPVPPPSAVPAPAPLVVPEPPAVPVNPEPAVDPEPAADAEDGLA